MINLTNQIRLQVAERSAGSFNFLALLRWALVIIFLWFGGMKFTAYEAASIAPFIEHSPIMSWLHALFGVQGASYVLGVIELSTAAALILGAFQPIFSALGAAMSAATYLITLTFFLSTPGVTEGTAGSLPPAHFLLKDLVLLAASLSLLFASVTNQIRFQIAEKSAGSFNFLSLLRWALVIIFLWFGGYKFTADEAARIAVFIEHSPIMSWLHALFGVQGASYVLGVIELSTAAALILGAFQPIFSALGAAMSAATYLITLTFFLSTPGVAEATAGGFPAISSAPGQFLLKDLVLLAASLSLLFASVQGPWLNVQKS
jgi:uncharacterized membrane protein YkgB